ncbi:MAG: hypothetical protein FJ399_09980 [Verrucomicrobia bacterium]|nr:hypothetical protein [Verrucomicrobiota bacterium]
MTLSRSAAAAPQAWGELTLSTPTPPSSLGTFPQDVAVSHNGNRAAIRYANPNSNAAVIAVWGLGGSGLPTGSLATFGGIQNGVAMKSGMAIDLSDPNFGYWPSDRVELTNVIGVSIGAGPSAHPNADPLLPQETLIETFEIGSSAPQFLRQWVIESTLATAPTPEDFTADKSGYAHDVAITRDGAWAVINSDNWIHVLNLGNAKDPASLTSFNIGDISYDPANPGTNLNWHCTPNQAVDSIAVTNERAIVTTARHLLKGGTTTNPQGPPTTWVYIVDLTTSPPSIVLQHDLAPPPSWTIQGNDDDRPHDIAITPHTDLQLGAVPLAVVTTNHTVAVYNLDTNQFLSSVFAAEEFRQYQLQVDSVEMTGERAVVICDYEQLNSSPPPLYLPSRWRVEVFDLDPVTGLRDAQGNVVSTEYTGPVTEIPERTHDLAIDKGFDKALIRTSFDNVVLTSILNPPPPTQLAVLPSPGGSNAHAYRDYGTAQSEAVFSSDSTVIGTVQTVNGVQRLMGATIGGRRLQPTSPFEGAVDVIDLAAATLSVTQVTIVPSGGLGSIGCVPLDLAIAFNQEELLVRSVEPDPQAPNAIGPDVTRWKLQPTIGLLGRCGGSGTIAACDSLAVPGSGFVSTSKRTLTISQEPQVSSPAGNDYNHFVEW